MLNVLYRICNSENLKSRPAFYSKASCLKNFLVALERVRDARMVLISAGEPSTDCIKLLPAHIEVEILKQCGNSASFLHALRRSLQYPPTDLVYFVEDDYLHVPQALEKLLDCHRELQPDYITLYDHPARYWGPEHPHADLPLRTKFCRVTATHHWRNVESTCMTFSARTETLRQDCQIIINHLAPKAPQDRELFRHLQGLGKYSGHEPPRVLIGPVPSLATHCEDPWLAPVIDWAALANNNL